MSERRVPERTLLFISLALNILVLGAVGGAVFAGVRVQRPGEEATAPRTPGQRAFMAALPPETRARLREEFLQTAVEARALRQRGRQARREAFAALAGEPYDAERARAAFARLRAADQATIGAFHDSTIDALAGMSAEDRRIAVEAMSRQPPPGRARPFQHPARRPH